MQTINIGTEINLDDLIQSRMLIQANSGGGKSNIARILMEKSFGLVPFIVFDRDGEYYTLKELHPDIVVIGGDYADLEISLQAASLLPKQIIAARLSVIIDLSNLKAEPKQQYVKDFLEAMMELPQTHWTRYLILIEEAHFFCGQQDRNEAGPAVRELMSGGRKRGYCGILITQRISKLHKDAAAEVNNKFIGKTTLDVDMDRAAKELGFSASKDRLQLRDLDTGKFFCYGTAINPQYVHQVQINLAQTKSPKAESITNFKPGKPTDKVLSALQKLNDLPKEAAKEKKTIAELQAEIGALKMELSKKPPVANVDELKSIQQKFYDANKQLEQKDKLIQHYESQREGISALLSKPHISKSATQKEQTILVSKESLPPAKQSANNAQSYNKPAKIITTSGEKLGKCAMAILSFLASYPERSWSKAQVGIATGYSPSSGGFNNALSELNTKSLVERDGGKISLHRHGSEMNYLPADFRQQTYSIETFKSKLGKCEREIYEAVLEQPERWFTKPDLAFHTPSNYSPTSGGFNNALSTLTTLELIERKNGEVRLNPELLEM